MTEDVDVQMKAESGVGEAGVEAPEESTEKETGVTKDPLLQELPNIVRENDYVILVFADGRNIFAQAVTSKKGKTPPVKINKRSYPTANMIGLPYGTVLELGMGCLVPLPEGEDIVPTFPVQGLEGEEETPTTTHFLR